MKNQSKILLPLFLFLFPLPGLMAQEKLSGIGQFKIGSSKKLLQEYIQKNSLTYENDDFKEAIRNNDYDLAKKISQFEDSFDKQRIRTYEIDSSVSDPFSEQDLYCKDVSIYMINFLKIGDLQVRAIKLKYYQDSLYSIESRFNIDLNDALTLKYGKPKLEEKLKTIYCIYKLTGIKEPHEEKVYYSTWPSPMGVKSQSVLMVYFDDKCKKGYLQTFSIINSGKAKIVENYSKDGKERLVKLIDGRKLNSLREL